MADPNNPLNAPPEALSDSAHYNRPHPAVEGDTYPTNEVGAMVPNINRIPGERPYDPADELKPAYDRATSEPGPYQHVNYMCTGPDLSNPNDLAHPDNPKNKPLAEPAFDPYATPQAEGFDPTRPGDPTNPSTHPQPGQSYDPRVALQQGTGTSTTYR
jgi:hypothetical protein